MKSPDTKTRMTCQRQVILEELRGLDTHPTAQELYDIVKMRLPHVSLGTVYRNLEKLAEGGEIKRLGVSENQRRFDGRMENHYHVRCISCGRVDDVLVRQLPAIKNIAQRISGYEIIGHNLEFSGFCHTCKKQR